MKAKEGLSEISLGIDNISIPLLSKDLKGKKKKVRTFLNYSLIYQLRQIPTISFAAEK